MASLEDLAPLIGAWDTEAVLPGSRAVVRGRTTFEALERGGYLIQRAAMDDPVFPAGVCVIGPSADDGRVVQHYFDSRGVSRIYDVELTDGVLRIWRDGPDFAQRYTGRLSDDGDRIQGAWEREEAGRWIHDFDLIYLRAR